MAKEYIEREALLEEINRNRAEAHNERCAQLLEAILNAPAADVAEVVRCKDCKYSVKYSCKNDACYQFTICRRRESYSEGVEEDDFCSYGERKMRENEKDN